MNTTNNTILITGGSAGIGFEVAKLLSAAGNKLIITGRNQERLDKAVALLPNTTGIVSDVSRKEDIEKLVSMVRQDFPELNIIINNAGRALVYDLTSGEQAFENAEDEMFTNYLSVIRLNEQLLPILSAQPTAAIVNVSSIVAFVPGSLATYSASKAALHSYTQSLRISLQRKGIVKVFELMPPLVNTEFSAPIGGANGISPKAVALDLLDGLKHDRYEIRTGDTQYIYDLYRSSPEEALQVMQSTR